MLIHLLAVMRTLITFSPRWGKLQLDWLLRHFPPRLIRSAYVFINGFITIAVLALLALVTRNPFVFPSLWPTAYLLFFSPLAKTSTARNTVDRHAIGLICGYAAYVLTGALMVPLGRQSPAGRRHHPDCFAWDYFQAARAANYRACRISARCSSPCYQPARRTALSALERFRTGQTC